MIQVKDDVDRCQVVVPVHPEVLKLGNSLLADEEYAAEALKTARKQFERDAVAYIEALRSEGSLHPSLRLDEYRRWNDEWRFTFFPYGGILAMRWELAEPEPCRIGLFPHVCITNEYMHISKDGPRRAEIDDAEMAPNVGILYGSTTHEDYLLIPHKTMLEYEKRDDVTQVVHEADANGTHLVVSAFCSSYTRNVPQALLMRDWAVDYHNRLLGHVESV